MEWSPSVFSWSILRGQVVLVISALQSSVGGCAPKTCPDNVFSSFLWGGKYVLSELKEPFRWETTHLQDTKNSSPVGLTWSFKTIGDKFVSMNLRSLGSLLWRKSFSPSSYMKYRCPVLPRVIQGSTARVGFPRVCLCEDKYMKTTSLRDANTTK